MGRAHGQMALFPLAKPLSPAGPRPHDEVIANVIQRLVTAIDVRCGPREKLDATALEVVEDGLACVARLLKHGRRK